MRQSPMSAGPSYVRSVRSGLDRPCNKSNILGLQIIILQLVCFTEIYTAFRILIQPHIQHNLLFANHGLLVNLIPPSQQLDGPDSSVSIATDYGLDGLGSNPGGDENFRPSKPALRSTQPPVKWVPGLSRG
jgi:hypothetical protein